MLIMATNYMSKITLPVNIDGTIANVEFTIKDAEARQMITDLGNALYWIGVTTTALSEGATTNPISVDGQDVTAKLGGLASYDGMEYAWNGSAWQGMGPNNLGALAYKSSASGDYTPAGSVSISKGTDTTDTVTGVSANGTLPQAYFTQSGETLTFNFNAGALPTLGAEKTFVTQRGDDTASFSGTPATVTVE
jgi:hypothetical protein